MPNWKKLIVSGSDANLASLNIDGALTASSAYLESASIGHLQTIYETASVIYSSGSTKFGNTLDDTHEITGSLLVTGSITGDLTGTASIANFATTASYALNSAGGGGGGGGVGATNQQTISVDLHVSQSENLMLLQPFEVADGTTITVEDEAFLYATDFSTPSLVDSASFAETASYVLNSQTASFIETAQTASHALQAQNNNSASGSLSFWQGSQAEYDLISASADPNTVYFVV